MKSKISVIALVAALSIPSAFAEDWNTGTDLIKAGATLAVTGPVVFPVKAVQKAVQGKLPEAAVYLLFTPVTPIVGVGLAGFGVLCDVAVSDTSTQTDPIQPTASVLPKPEIIDPATYKKQPLQIKHSQALNPAVN